MLTSGPDLDDVQLLDRIAAGDAAALQELYSRYSRPLFTYLLRLTLDEAGAEDLLQEVFLVAWNDAARYRGAGLVRNWLFKIAHNQAVSWLRYARRYVGLPEDEDNQAGPDIEDLAHVRWRSTSMTNALNKLPPGQRAVIELAFYYDMSYQEIAEILGCPVGTVKSRMNLAKHSLTRSLQRPALDGIGEELA